ncbi:MAG: hypothetical protein ACC667_02935 [Longimicrobiales bacterium]
MDVKKAFCPSCDHEVRLTITPDPSTHGGHANVADGHQVVCLDFIEGCADRNCSLSGLPAIVMGMRLARSEIEQSRWKTIHALCDGCGDPRDMKIVDSTYAYCTQCGTTNRWTVIDLEDESRVAIMEKRWEQDGGPAY